MENVEATLLTTFNTDAPPARLNEYNTCLEHNCRCGSVAKIVLLLEGDPQRVYEHQKIELVPIDERPTLNYLFDYANANLRGGYVIIANADIYFDDESNLDRLAEMREGAMWALTRYEYDREKKKWELKMSYACGSYDTFAFKSPLKKFSVDHAAAVGSTNGMESYFVAGAIRGGVPVANPALSIVSKHLHASNVRTRKPYYPKGHKNKGWASIQDLPEYKKLISRRVAACSAIESIKYYTRLSTGYTRFLAMLKPKRLLKPLSTACRKRQ